MIIFIYCLIVLLGSCDYDNIYLFLFVFYCLFLALDSYNIYVCTLQLHLLIYYQFLTLDVYVYDVNNKMIYLSIYHNRIQIWRRSFLRCAIVAFLKQKDIWDLFLGETSDKSTCCSYLCLSSACHCYNWGCLMHRLLLNLLPNDDCWNLIPIKLIKVHPNMEIVSFLLLLMSFQTHMLLLMCWNTRRIPEEPYLYSSITHQHTIDFKIFSKQTFEKTWG